MDELQVRGITGEQQVRRMELIAGTVGSVMTGEAVK